MAERYDALTAEAGADASASDVANATNGAAAVTYAAAGAGLHNVIGGVAWSYSAAPTSASLQIEDGSGTVVFKIDITSAGPGYVPFQRPKKGSANTALIVTLASGGAGVVGRVSVLSAWVE